MGDEHKAATHTFNRLLHSGEVRVERHIFTTTFHVDIRTKSFNPANRSTPRKDEGVINALESGKYGRTFPCWHNRTRQAFVLTYRRV